LKAVFPASNLQQQWLPLQIFIDGIGHLAQIFHP
jgi:hypothetical protein